MSQKSATASSSSNFQVTFYASMQEYRKKTKKDLFAHPLMAQLQTCNSPADVLTVLHTQVQQIEQSMSGDDKLTKWLTPTVNVLYAFSGVLGAGVGLVFSPASVIFAGASVLLSTAKDVLASHDTLVYIFERIEGFFRRLETYIEVPKMEAMKDIIMKIMVEVLGIFGIVTKEMKQGQARKYLKKLIGRRDLEDALSRLDMLTQEEVWMATVQVLKVARRVEDKVDMAIEDGKVIKVTTMETRTVLQHTAKNMDEVQRRRVRTGHRAWLSPPDPSTNQNIACSARHKGTATWFFQRSISEAWKSKSASSLLWIHGKPGSGKSILCSAIIQDLMALQEAGLATMAYFYFDFRDINKQNLHNALPSLLTQLSAHSDRCCDVLSRVYKVHNDGAHKLSTSTMIACLKEMLVLPGQGPIYIVLDALEECPNTPRISSARKRVLDLLNDLVGLQLSNLHICITSRPEIDIRSALEPLVFLSVSIHDQSGQKKDIEDYIRSVVYADSDTAMGRWRDQDKELVIKTLAEKADGMFRWVFCQLEVLQHCFPEGIRRALNELPKTLDETYERVLKEIGLANRDHAHRLLRCLTLATRPLRVEELAEILALDSEGAQGVTPATLNKDWRWEDRQRAVLSTCSSLITLVDDGYSRVIQFSHFSVKEFLTSNRFSTSKEDISHFHVTPEPAAAAASQRRSDALADLGASHSSGNNNDIMSSLGMGSMGVSIEQASQQPEPSFDHWSHTLLEIKQRIESLASDTLLRLPCLNQREPVNLVSLPRIALRLLLYCASFSTADFASPNGFLGPPASVSYYPTGDLEGDRNVAFTAALDCLDELMVLLTGSGKAEIAGALSELAQALNDLGLHEYASSVSGFALEILRDLYAVEPDRFRSRVASTQSLRANIFVDLRQNDEAEDAAEEAVAIFKEYGNAQTELVYAMLNYAVLLGSIGRGDSAAAVAFELVGFFDDPANIQPDLVLVSPLCQLCVSNACIEFDIDLALSEAEKAIEASRAQLDGNSKVVLAGALLTKSKILSSIGQNDHAYAISAEAVTLFRSASVDRHAFSLLLAHALITHSHQLSEVNRKGDLYSTIHEMAMKWQTLRLSAPIASKRLKAWALFELVKCRHKGADKQTPRNELQIAESAVSAFRDVEPLDYAGLADALYLYADRMLELGNSRDAATYAEESVQYFREARDKSPHKYALDLIFSLSLASSCLACTERSEDALEYAKQAVDVQYKRQGAGEVQYDGHLRKLLMDVVFRATEMGKHQQDVGPWMRELQRLCESEGGEYPAWISSIRKRRGVFYDKYR